MTAILWHIELSHYNEKARWALDHKRVPHERRVPMPGLHGPVALWLTRGGQRRLPVVELDGRRIGDSTAIVAALEERWPDPPLYPQDPAERARALALEDYFDEELAPRVRRLIWHHTLPDTDAVIDALMPDGPVSRKRLLRAMAPVARPILRADYDVGERTAAEAMTGIRAAMDRIEEEVGPGGHLVGECFSVADLAACALFTPLLCPAGRQYSPRSTPEPLRAFRAELETRPGGVWIAEMYARHRGVSAEVPRSRR